MLRLAGLPKLWADYEQVNALGWNKDILLERHLALKALTALALHTGRLDAAAKYFSQYNSVNDTLHSNANAVNFEEVKFTMESFRIEREYANLRLKSRQQWWLFGGFSAFLLLVAAFTYLGFLNNRKHANRFRDLSNSTFEGIILHDGGVILDVNSKVSELLQLAPKLLLGRSLLDFIDVKFHPIVQSTMTSTLGLSMKLLRAIQRDGNSRAEILSRPIIFNDRRVRVIAMRDISLRKKAETQLVESERVFSTWSATFQGWSIGVKTTGTGTMLFLSDGCLELTGYHPVDLIGNNRVAYNDLVLEEFQGQLYDRWQQALAEFKTLEQSTRSEQRRVRIKWVWEKGSGVFNEQGELLALEGFITDITERKNAEYALRDSEEQFRLVVETFPFPMALANPRNGRILYTNLECVRVFKLNAGMRQRYRLETFFIDLKQRDKIVKELETRAISAHAI